MVFVVPVKWKSLARFGNRVYGRGMQDKQSVNDFITKHIMGWDPLCSECAGKGWRRYAHGDHSEICPRCNGRTRDELFDWDPCSREQDWKKVEEKIAADGKWEMFIVKCAGLSEPTEQMQHTMILWYVGLDLETRTSAAVAAYSHIPLDA